MTSVSAFCRFAKELARELGCAHKGEWLKAELYLTQERALQLGYARSTEEVIIQGKYPRAEKDTDEDFHPYVCGVVEPPAPLPLYRCSVHADASGVASDLREQLLPQYETIYDQCCIKRMEYYAECYDNEQAGAKFAALVGAQSKRGPGCYGAAFYWRVCNNLRVEGNVYHDNATVSLSNLPHEALEAVLLALKPFAERGSSCA